MTAKRKPAMRTQAQRAPSARIVETWHEHPKWTLAAIAAVVGIVSSIAPVGLSALHYFTTHAEFEQHQKHDESKDAWGAVQSIKLETIMARNRVNDCDVAKTHGKAMTDIERNACNQYAEELRDATARFETARAEAIATTKEKQ